jgi:ribose transport system permease protein
MTSSVLSEPRRFSWRVDLRYRLPAKYLVSWIGLAAVLLVAAMLQPATFGTLSIGLITGLAGCMLVASLGQNLVVMLGAVDLSVPALMTLAAAINVHLVGQVSPVLSLAMSILVCGALSAISGALIHYLRLNALIVTFAMNAIVAAGLLLWLGQSFSSTGRTADWLQSFAGTSVLNVSWLFWVALVICAITAGVLTRTRVGRTVAAVGANPRAARMLGTQVDRVVVSSFAAAGVFYALAGLFLAGLVQTPNPSLGTPYQLATITVVAIAGTSFAGGSSSIASLIAAALLLTTLSQVLALQNLSAGAIYVVQGVFLIIAVSLHYWAQLSRDGLKRVRATLGSVRPPA